MDLVLGELAGPDKNLFTSLVGGDIGTVDMSAMEKELLSRFPTAKVNRLVVSHCTSDPDKFQ
jgi:hypothetical protein